MPHHPDTPLSFDLPRTGFLRLRHILAPARSDPCGQVHVVGRC